MSPHLGVFLDWSVIDIVFVAIGVQQYISISRDLKRTRAREAAEKQALQTGHPEGQ